MRTMAVRSHFGSRGESFRVRIFFAVYIAWSPIACRLVIKCGKSGCTGSCPLSVVEYGYAAGKKPATCRTCGKTFPRPNVTLLDFLPAKSERKSETGVETPLLACHAAVETSLPLCLVNQMWSLGVIHLASNRKRTVKMQSWKTVQKPIRPRSTRRSRRTTSCGKFSRTCQRNTGRLSTVTVSSQKCNRWMMRKLPCWQPKGNSYPCKVGNESRLIRTWKQPTLNRCKPNKRWRCWWLNRLQKMQKLSIKEIQGFSLTRQDPPLIKLHNTPFSQCSNPFSRCKAWGATVFRNSSWRLARLRRMSRKSAKLWHRLCGHWRQGSRPLHLVPRRTASRAKWWARMKSSPVEYAYLDSAKSTPKDKKPSKGSCQTPQRKRGDWRRNANRKAKVCSLLRLWIWIQIIAVPFYLSLPRIGETDNLGRAHATAKLLGVQFEAIGQWAANLTSKSEMELTPFLAQIGKCRQMFSESFEKASHPCTSSVSQNTQGTHSHTDFLPPACFH